MIFHTEEAQILVGAVTAETSFWLIALRSQWAYLIKNDAIIAICLDETYRDNTPTLYSLTPTHPHPWISISTFALTTFCVLFMKYFIVF